MSNTPNPTPTPPPVTPPPEPPKDTLRESFMKSLQLTVEPTAPDPQVSAIGEPAPDTGVEKTTGPNDFTPESGSMHEILARMKRNPAPEPAPAAPVTPPEPAPVTPPPAPAAVTPPPAPVTPAPTPTPAVTPPTPVELTEAQKQLRVPEFPKRETPVADPKPSPSTLDMSGLDDDEIYEVRTAEFAEAKYPDKYKGHAQRVLDFIKKHKQYVQTAAPESTLDRDDAEYQRFLKANKPTVTDTERRRLERERRVEEAAVEAQQRLAPATQKLSEELTLLKAAPLVEKTINDYKSLVKEVMPKDDDPLVKAAVEETTATAVDAGKEFLLLASRLKDYDSRNSTHVWLGDFIAEQGELFVKSGHPSLKRGGKTFVPRAKYNVMPPDERAKHFTFTDEDVLNIIAINAKSAAEYRANTERTKLEKMGYRRVSSSAAPATPPVSATPPVAEPSPRAMSSTAAGDDPGPSSPTDPFLRFMGAVR